MSELKALHVLNIECSACQSQTYASAEKQHGQGNFVFAAASRACMAMVTVAQAHSTKLTLAHGCIETSRMQAVSSTNKSTVAVIVCCC